MLKIDNSTKYINPLFFLLIMAGFSIDPLTYLYTTLRSVFTDLVVALIILLIGFILGKTAGKIILKVLKEVELNKIIQKTTGIKVSVSEIISKGITYFIYFIFIIAALEKLNISAVAFNLLAGGVIIIIIISIFLSIKDFIPNIIAGIYITQKKFVSKGDVIKIDKIEGKIIDVQLNTTKLETKKGDILFIPNSNLLKSKIIKLRTRLKKQ